jgi:hypothetical protein
VVNCDCVAEVTTPEMLNAAMKLAVSAVVILADAEIHEAEVA